MTFRDALFMELELAVVLRASLSLVEYLRRRSQHRVLERVPDPRDPKRPFTTNPILPQCP